MGSSTPPGSTCAWPRDHRGARDLRPGRRIRARSPRTSAPTCHSTASAATTSSGSASRCATPTRSRSAWSPRLQYSLGGAADFANVPVGGRESDVPFYVGSGVAPIPGRPGHAARTEAGGDPGGGHPHARPRRRHAGASARGARDGRDIPSRNHPRRRLVHRGRVHGQGHRARCASGKPSTSASSTAAARSPARPRRRSRELWEPKFSLSPGQRNGVPVGRPADARPAAVSEMDFPLVTPAFAAAWPESNAIPHYRLALALPTTPGTAVPNAAPFTSPHLPDVSLVSDTCAICHRAHAAQGPNLLTSAAPQSAMCFTCHDGTGSNLATKVQFDNAPANDPVTRSYYRHDATVVPPRTRSTRTTSSAASPTATASARTATTRTTQRPSSPRRRPAVGPWRGNRPRSPGSP